MIISNFYLNFFKKKQFHILLKSAPGKPKYRFSIFCNTRILPQSLFLQLQYFYHIFRSLFLWHIFYGFRGITIM
jgi:hypothetical protein